MAASMQEILTLACSPDPAVRSEAEQRLFALSQAQPDAYILQLAEELSSDDREPNVRMLAGIVLKNAFRARSAAEQRELNAQWAALPGDTKAQIKNAVLNTLASDVRPAQQGAAQVVSKIANIELATDDWPELVPLLSEQVLNADAPTHVRVGALETIGWIADDAAQLDSWDAIEAHANTMLTAVVHGLRDDEPHDAVRVEAARALYHVVGFARSAFAADAERGYLMQVVYGAARSPNDDVRLAAFECLVQIADEHYAHLQDQITTIYELTTACLANEDEEDDIVLQAIEFWTAIADCEIDALEQAEDAAQLGVEHESASLHFVNDAAPHLAGPVLATLLRQEEDQDDADAWNVSMAGATCLAHLAQAIGDEITPLVQPFIEANLACARANSIEPLQADEEAAAAARGSADTELWRRVEAAVMAFGSMLDGPTDSVKKLTSELLPDLLGHMQSEHGLVKDSAAWAVGRVCELHPDVATSGLNHMLDALGTALGDPKPRIAAIACWSIHSIVEYVAEVADEHAASGAGGEPPLSLADSWNDLAKAIFETTSRRDIGQGDLRGAAFEALNALILHAPPAVTDTIVDMLPTFTQLINDSVAAGGGGGGGEDEEERLAMQGLCCSVLQAIIAKLDADVAPFADQIMAAVGAVLKHTAASESGIVSEEALLATGALANAIGEQFGGWMGELAPILVKALKNVRVSSLCLVAVGTVGDCCRAVGPGMAPHLAVLFGVLVDDLKSEDLDQDVKPAILACFGDLAMATGKDFFPYVVDAMVILRTASQTSVDSSLDEVDYLRRLHESVLTACVGIVHAFEDPASSEGFEGLDQFANFMLAFACHVASSQPSESALHVIVGLIGDVASVLGRIDPNIKDVCKNESSISAILNAASQHPNPSINEVARYSMRVLSM